MGNQTSQILAEDVNVLLVRFPPLSTDCTALGSTKLYKTARCIDQQSSLFVKVFSTAGIDKSLYKKKLESLNSMINKQPQKHLLPFLHLEKEGLAVVYRPYIHSTLRQKITRPPFLNSEEKNWISYLLMKSVQQIHSSYCVHGDIRLENFLITSWGWVFLSDLSFYKPYKIPEGDMTAYNLYFAPGKREACYLAPERFDSKSREIDPSSSSDIFSLGCVIAEVYLDGANLFTLPQLLAYKKGELNVLPKLHQIPEDIKNLVVNMISVDPDRRWEIDKCISYWEEKILRQEVFNEIYCFCLGLLSKTTADEQVLAVQEFVKSFKIGEYSVIFCSLLGSLIRNLSKPSFKILAIDLMTRIAVTDELKLHRVIPFFIDLLNRGERNVVKVKCLNCIVDVTSKIDFLTPKETHLFKEYIWPLVSKCKNDESEWVKLTLAELMPRWAYVARRFLEIGRHFYENQLSFDAQLSQLGDFLGNTFRDLLKNSEDSIKLVLLSNFPYFAESFSDQFARKTFREIILPALYSGERLNDTIAPWIEYEEKYQIALLQEAEQYIKVLGTYFFKHAFQYLENNLYGHSELLVYLTLKAMNYHSRISTDLLEKTLPYILHPSYWIRDEMKKLIIDILNKIDPVMNFLQIKPMLTPYLALESKQVMLIDTTIINNHLYNGIRRSAVYTCVLGKDPVFIENEAEVKGSFLSLVPMLRLPLNRSRPLPRVPEPEENLQIDKELEIKQKSSGFYRKATGSKIGYIEGIGLSGDLEVVLTDHNSPVTHILPTSENLVVSASKDGRILLWKIRLSEDFSKSKFKEFKEELGKKNISMDKLKYKEIKEDFGKRPISMGNCGDYVFITYQDACVIWDSELTQKESELAFENLAASAEIDNNSFLIADYKGNVFIRDVREEHHRFLFEIGPQNGVVSTMQKITEQSAALGTISGCLVLFDLRFNLPSSVYMNSYKLPILSMSTYNFRYKPIIDGSQLLTALSSEIVMWDLNTSWPSVLFAKKDQTPLQVPHLIPKPYYFHEYSHSCPTSFNSSYYSLSMSRLDAYSKISNKFITNFTEFGVLAKKAWESKGNVLKILTIPGSTSVLSAGEDSAVRIWDPLNPSKSFILGQSEANKFEYFSSLIPDLLVVQEQTLPLQSVKKKRRDFDEFAVLRKISHPHSINDMAYITQPKPLLLTGSNDGTIRIWG